MDSANICNELNHHIPERATVLDPFVE